MVFLKPETITAVQAAHRLSEPTSFIMDLSPLVILYVTNTQTGYMIPTRGTGLAP